MLEKILFQISYDMKNLLNLSTLSLSTCELMLLMVFFFLFIFLFFIGVRLMILRILKDF
jgi:hypothetical protein